MTFAEALGGLVAAGQALSMSTNPMAIAEQADQFIAELLTLPPVSIPGHDSCVWRMQTIREAEQFVEVIRRAARRIDARTGPRRAIAQQDAREDVDRAEQPLLVRLDDLRFVVETPPPLASEKELIAPVNHSSQASILRAMLELHDQLSTTDEISGRTGKETGCFVSLSVARKTIRVLLKDGLVHRPQGLRGGTALTAKGKRLASMLPKTK